MIDYRENAKWTVYIHIVPKEISGYEQDKYYVGITSLVPTYRWCNGKGYKEQYFYRAIQKYGWHNIKHEIIAENLTEDEAINFEILLINKLNSNNSIYGYNISDGGFGSKGLKGEKNPLFGIPLSEETKRKLSESAKGKKLSDETKQKISIAVKEMWKDEDFKRSRSGINHHCYGKHRTDVKYGFDNPTSKPVICLNTLKIYGSACEAGKDFSSFSTICACCRGEKYCAGKDSDGYVLLWMWYDDYKNKTKQEINNYIISNLLNTRDKPVVNLDTKQVFCSPKRAMEYYNLTIANAYFTNIIKNKKTYCGYKWQYLAEYLQENNILYEDVKQSLLFIA